MIEDTNIPKASVLLPVFNGEAYLDSAIESVLNQSFANFELLILDDGSTDGSLRIARSAAERDTRCRVFSWSNRGLVATLNDGASLSRGDLIIRMDSDDICAKDRFLIQIRFMDEHPDHVAVGCRFKLVDPEGLEIGELQFSTEHKDIDRHHLTGEGAHICHPASIIRKRAFDQVGGYRSKFQYAEDLDLFLRLGEIGSLANLPHLLFYYRQHLKSIGSLYRDEQVRCAREAVLDACERFAEARFLLWAEQAGDHS